MNNYAIIQRLIDEEYKKVFSTNTSTTQISEPLTIEKLKETCDMLEREFPVNCALARLKAKYTNLEIMRMMEYEK